MVLGSKYLEILQAHGKEVQAQLNSERLDTIFKSIGAQVQTLGASDEILPHEAQVNGQRLLPPSLKRIAALLETAAPW
jgi:hypothetical protein